jgi:histidine triad (HIT) family protein
MRNFAMVLARTRLGGLLVRTILSAFPSAMPAERILETEYLLAFNHPDPSHAVHVLIVPKAPFSSINELVKVRPELLGDVYRAALDLAQDLDLVDKGFRVIVNAGKYQDVKTVHFHLVSGDAVE